MKGFGRKAILLVLALVFALSSFSLTAFADEYTGLDLSASQTEYQLGGTGNVVVKGVNADGSLSAPLTTGVTFASSDTEVATVSATGAVTPVNEGITNITATVGSLTGSVIIVVYKAKPYEELYEENLVRRADFADKPSIRVEDTTEESTSIARTGKALKTNLILAPQAREEGGLTVSGVRYRTVIASPGGTPKDYGVAQFWFYDDMVNNAAGGKNPAARKQVSFYLSNSGTGNPADYKDEDGNPYEFFPDGSPTEGSGKGLTHALRRYITLNGVDNCYSTSADGNTEIFGEFKTNNLPRSKGWHQVLIDYSRPTAFTIYIDGKVLATRETEQISNAGLSQVTVERYGISMEAADGANHTIYVDDFARYDISTSRAFAPEVRGVKADGRPLEGQTLSVSYVYNDKNNDPEDKSKLKVQWQASANQKDWTDLGTAGTNKTYTLTGGDVDKYIRAVVTASATVEPFESEPVASNIIGPVEAKPDLDSQTFNYLDLGKTNSTFAKDATGGQMQVFGISDNGTYDLTESGRVSYLSDDRSVATVDKDGKISFHGDGYATITATITNKDGKPLSASMMITVYDPAEKHAEQGFENYTIKDPTKNTHLTLIGDPVRTGSKAMAYRQPPTGATAEQWGLFLFRNGAFEPMYVASAWFYDSGEKSNAKTGIYLQGHDGTTDGKKFPQTLSSDIGVLDDSSDYYTYKNPASNRANVGPGGLDWSADEANKGKGYIGDHVVPNITALDGGTVTPTGGEPVQKPVIKRARGWHQVTAVAQGGTGWTNVGTNKGYIKVFIDGVEAYTDHYVPNALHLIGGRSYYPADGEISSYYDDLSIFHFTQKAVKPGISSLYMTGIPMVGQTLSAEATAWDKNGDAITAIKYQWKVSSDGETWTNINGATSETYTVADGDKDKFICVGVTPVSNEEGEEDLSAPTKAIMEKKDPPTASGVTLSGTPNIGEELKITYTYVKSANGDEEGVSTFLWERADSESGPWTAIPNATEAVYAPSAADAGKYIRGSVIPTDKNGLPGSPVAAASVMKISTDVVYFVATDGNDNNPGSSDKPFASLEKARDVIRAAKEGGSLPSGQIVVNIKGGTYPLKKTFTLSEADSGTEESPIIYQAYNNEKVTFTGGLELDFSKFKPIADTEMKNKLRVAEARDKVLVADLADLGIDKLDKYPIKDNNAVINTPIFLFDGKAMNLARWPNNDNNAYWPTFWCDSTNTGEYAGTYPGNGEGSGAEKPAGFTVQYDSDIPNTWTHNKDRWSAGGATDEIITMGYWKFDWYASATYVTIDQEKSRISAPDKIQYGVMEKARRTFRFYNVYEEIDEPGEWYIDRVAKKMYLYPSNDNPNPEIKMSMGAFDFVNATNASYITIKGIEFTGGKKSGIIFNGGQHNTIDSCDLNSFEEWGAKITGGYNSGIKNSHVHQCGVGGITLSGGDKYEFIMGNNYVTNNEINDFALQKQSYSPGVNVNGIGNLIDHNEFYNCPHQAMALFGTLNTVEYNEFHDVTINAADMGAIYTGRRFDDHGLVVRYNHFYNIGNPLSRQFHPCAVFTDDGSSDMDIYGNVFGTGVATCETNKIHGGQLNKIYNNLFIDAPVGLYMADWNDDAWKGALLGTNSGRKPEEYKDRLELINKNEHYYTRWPWLRETWENPDAIVHHSNTFTKNILIYINEEPDASTQSHNKGNGGWWRSYGIHPITGIEDNTVITKDKADKSWFADFDNGDFTVGEEVFAMQEGFEPIPFDKIGRYTETAVGLRMTAEQIEMELNNIQAGSDLGQYPQSAIDTMRTALSTAKTVYDNTGATEEQITAAGAALDAAYTAFGKQMVRTVNVTGNEYTIPQGFKNAVINRTGDLNGPFVLKVPGGALNRTTVNVTLNGQDYSILYSDGTEVTSEELLVIEPLADTTPATAGNIFGAAFRLGGTEGSFNIPVRVLAQGLAGKTAVFSDGKSVSQVKSKLKTDSAAGLGSGTNGWIKVGDDLALWIRQMGQYAVAELVDESDEAKLSTITVDGVEIRGFNPSKYSYTLTLENGAAIPAIAATPVLDKATIEVSEPASIPGEWKARVVAPSGASKTYTVKLNYKGGGSDVTPPPSAPPINGNGGGNGGGGNGGGGTTSIGSGNPIGVATPNVKPQESAMFSDTVGHWAKADIEEMANRGVVSGVGDGLFEPDRPVTRAEFAALITRALGLPQGQAQDWKDVASDVWYAQPVSAAASVGIIAGYDGWFRPEERITREEMAVMMAKAYAYAGGQSPDTAGALEKYGDTDAVSSWAHESMEIASALGLIQGVTPSAIAPQDTATRAQAASILKRLLDLI